MALMERGLLSPELEWIAYTAWRRGIHNVPDTQAQCFLTREEEVYQEEKHCVSELLDLELSPNTLKNTVVDV